MRLIGEPLTVERMLAKDVLALQPDDRSVYGCGTIKLGEHIDELIAEHQAGKLFGAVGLVLTEEMVSQYSPDIRNRVGYFMKLGETPTVADDLGMEWALHLGFIAKKGTWLAWAANEDQAREQLNAVVKFGEGGETVVIADDVGIAIAAAIIDWPCLLFCVQKWGSEHNKQYVPLLRWARDSGVLQNVCWTKEELDAKLKDPVAHVSRSLVKERREQALAMISRPAVNPLERALGHGSDGSPPPSGCGRVLEIGMTFDPATHYDEHYYGGADGIRYCMPNGEWASYHSTAHEWGGFKLVAQWLRRLFPSAKTLLDLGCGSGAFARESLMVGFDAYGIDISESAIKHSELEGRLVCGDITKKEGLFQQYDCRTFDVISALDLWEHIALKDIGVLVESVKERLNHGGIGFFNICTHGNGEEDWTLEPPCQITKENSWLLVSGHLTIRTWQWWVDKFAEHGLAPRLDMCQLFQAMRCEDPSMCQASSWSPRNVVICERA